MAYCHITNTNSSCPIVQMLLHVAKGNLDFSRALLREALVQTFFYKFNFGIIYNWLNQPALSASVCRRVRKRVKELVATFTRNSGIIQLFNCCVNKFLLLIFLYI